MDATALSKLYALDGPFTTLYIDSSSTTEDAAAQYDVRWRNVLRELEDAGVDEATRDAVSAARGDHGRGGTRVVVATPGSVQLAISLPQPPAQEIVTTGNLPVLTPLVDALGLQVPHVVVLADRTGALPNVDLALGALTLATGMRDDAGEVLFATARTVGWMVHALDEYRERPLRLRPVGRYVGP